MAPRHFRYLEYGEIFQNVPRRWRLADNSWVVLLFTEDGRGVPRGQRVGPVRHLADSHRQQDTSEDLKKRPELLWILWVGQGIWYRAAGPRWQDQEHRRQPPSDPVQVEVEFLTSDGFSPPSIQHAKNVQKKIYIQYVLEPAGARVATSLVHGPQ